jgi:hypothetical protein
VAHQAETGDIRGGVRPEVDHQLAGQFVQRRHRFGRLAQARLPRPPKLMGEIHNAAAQDLAHGRWRQGVDGEADDGQRRLRHAAHGVDVADGVGGRDLAERVGVVHAGREDIHSQDCRRIGRQQDHARIVAGTGPHQHARIIHLRQSGEDLVQDGLADLRGAAGVAHVLRQAHRPVGRCRPLAGAVADVLALKLLTGAGLAHIADAVPQRHRAGHDQPPFLQLPRIHLLPPENRPE